MLRPTATATAAALALAVAVPATAAAVTYPPPANPGRWLYHCYVFSHQDVGMAGWYLVE